MDFKFSKMNSLLECLRVKLILCCRSIFKSSQMTHEYYHKKVHLPASISSVLRAFSSFALLTAFPR